MQPADQVEEDGLGAAWPRLINQMQDLRHTLCTLHEVGMARVSPSWRGRIICLSNGRRGLGDSDLRCSQGDSRRGLVQVYGRSAPLTPSGLAQCHRHTQVDPKERIVKHRDEESTHEKADERTV